MALALDVKRRTVMGNIDVVFVDVDFDASYPAGGESLKPSDLGLQSVELVLAEAKDGFTFFYNRTNSKLIARNTIRRFSAAVDPASIAAQTSAETAVTLTGVGVDDEVVGVEIPASLEAGLAYSGARVSAADTVQLRLTNVTTAAVDGASRTWVFFVAKKNQEAAEIPDTTDLSGVTDVRLEVHGLRSN